MEMDSAAGANRGDCSMYETSWQHLADELKRLDLHIHMYAVALRNRRAPGPLDRFTGLVLSEEEMSCLVANLAAPFVDQTESSAPRLEAGPLVDALSEIEGRLETRRAASLKQGIELSLARLAENFH